MRRSHGIDHDDLSVAFALEQNTVEMIGDQLKIGRVVIAARLIFPIVVAGQVKRKKGEKDSDGYASHT